MEKYLLSENGKTFYGADGHNEKANHIEGMTEAKCMEEIKKFPKPELVKTYQLVELD